jgi:hypothetical protein
MCLLARFEEFKAQRNEVRLGDIEERLELDGGGSRILPIVTASSYCTLLIVFSGGAIYCGCTDLDFPNTMFSRKQLNKSHCFSFGHKSIRKYLRSRIQAGGSRDYHSADHVCSRVG